MKFLPGKQELLIFLVDSSGSMYPDNTPVNLPDSIAKYSQVQNSIIALINRINSTSKQNHILVSVIPFAGQPIILKPFDDNKLYAPARVWLNDDKLKNDFDIINDPESISRNLIGTLTSFENVFKQLPSVVSNYFSDTRIPPENHCGITIMFFSDGRNEPENDKLLPVIDSILTEINTIIDLNRKGISKKDDFHFSVCSIAIGENVDELTLQTIATQYTQIQDKNLKTLMAIDVDISMIIDPERAYLKLNTLHNSINDHELSILRKFLRLVTNTPT